SPAASRHAHLHSFPTRRSSDLRNIHVLTPNLNNGFYTNIIGSFMGYAYRAGYTVHISGYEYSPETEREHLRNLETGKPGTVVVIDRKSTRLNSSHVSISYAVFC